DLEEAKTIFSKIRAADALESSVASNIAFIRRVGKEPIIVDLVALFNQQVTAKGAKNATKSKTKAKAKGPTAPPQSTASSGTGNVAQLRRSVSGDSASSQENNDAEDRPVSRPTKRNRRR